jgi:hypothetical protein
LGIVIDDDWDFQVLLETPLDFLNLGGKVFFCALGAINEPWEPNADSTKWRKCLSVFAEKFSDELLDPFTLFYGRSKRRGVLF